MCPDTQKYGTRRSSQQPLQQPLRVVLSLRNAVTPRLCKGGVLPQIRTFNTKKSDLLSISISKEKIRAACWCARSSNGNGKTDDVVRAAERFHLDFLAISETHIPDQGEDCLENGWQLHWSGIQNFRSKSETAVLLSPLAVKALVSVEYTANRMHACLLSRNKACEGQRYGRVRPSPTSCIIEGRASSTHDYTHLSVLFHIINY
ncbi:unnamed protein product [Soboliphyme baturini]|uniref:Endo/exonuclease/phosphatase domain-containing protein n=1 Tax=Soboliphyme baturini TaxID=241478 RepID=A0A183IVY4_9BILA|nr:unnamed protein product [Soboliphyme baturini]